MQLSVFKKVTLPKTKEEKGSLAKYASKPNLPTVVECNDIKTLIKTVTTHGYSPSIFSEYRAKSGFLHTDFIILDVDDGLMISEALSRVQELNLMCLCLTTSSHTPENHRFRLIFPLLSRITRKQDYEATINSIYKVFPESDKQCRDSSRFFFPSHLSDDGFVHEGELYKPTIHIKQQNSHSKAPNLKRIVLVDQDIESIVESIYGTDKRTIPECIDYFIRNAHTGLEGSWNTSLNSFCFTLGLQGLTFDDVYDIITRLAPDDLDDKDEYVIERAYNQGLEAKESVDDSSKSW